MQISTISRSGSVPYQFLFIFERIVLPNIFFFDFSNQSKFEEQISIICLRRISGTSAMHQNCIWDTLPLKRKWVTFEVFHTYAWWWKPSGPERCTHHLVSNWFLFLVWRITIEVSADILGRSIDRRPMLVKGGKNWTWTNNQQSCSCTSLLIVLQCNLFVVAVTVAATDTRLYYDLPCPWAKFTRIRCEFCKI